MFLRHTIGRLELKNVTVDRSRIEDLKEDGVVADWIVLQAIDPSTVVLDGLRRIATDTTRVVWITSRDDSRFERAERVEIVNCGAKVWVFRLDQI